MPTRELARVVDGVEHVATITYMNLPDGSEHVTLFTCSCAVESWNQDKTKMFLDDSNCPLKPPQR